jgi:hypothetical protein
MKKLIVFIISSVFVITLAACSQTTTSSTKAEVTTTTSESLTTSQQPTTTVNFTSAGILTTSGYITTELTTNPSTTTELTTTSDPITTFTTAGPSLKTEVLPIHSSYYGNTNGNANNQGLAVYDVNDNLHYFALGPSVYSFNPGLERTELIFTLQSGGYVRNLCLSSDYLYFTDSTDGWMMKFNLSTSEITSVYEEETYYINRYDSNVFIDRLTVSEYSSYRSMNRYDDEDQLFDYLSTSGISNINISGTKIFFVETGSVTLRIMADNFSGKSTIYNFSGDGFTEIYEMYLIKNSYDGTREFALIANDGVSTALYVYNTTTGLEKRHPSTSGNLHSLNSDGINLYFIDNSALYAMSLTDYGIEKVMDLYANSKHLQVINHWIYFSNDTLTALYRINPETNEIESLT